MRINNRFYPAGVQAANRRHLFLCLLVISLAWILATGCTRPASQPPVVYATDSAPSIFIDRVQVNEGSGIYVSGRSTLPDGECVKTELLEDQKVLEWWPRDVCVEIANGKWEFLAALGRDGAPERLSPEVEYQIHAFWPEEPDAVDTRFPFDLKSPPLAP